MTEYVEILKRHVEENPPNYGSDAHSILEMLFSYYHECNNTDTDAVKDAFGSVPADARYAPPGDGPHRGCRLYPLPGA